jgi:hypothetical protein
MYCTYQWIQLKRQFFEFGALKKLYICTNGKSEASRSSRKDIFREKYRKRPQQFLCFCLHMYYKCSKSLTAMTGQSTDPSLVVSAMGLKYVCTYTVIQYVSSKKDDDLDPGFPLHIYPFTRLSDSIPRTIWGMF